MLTKSVNTAESMAIAPTSPASTLVTSTRSRSADVPVGRTTVKEREPEDGSLFADLGQRADFERRKVEHEDTVLDHRLSWLTTSQSIFATGAAPLVPGLSVAGLS